MSVFLVVRAIAVAILEVDAIVFDGLGLQLLQYPVVDRERQPGGRLDLAHVVGIRFQGTRQTLDIDGVRRQRIGARQTQHTGKYVVIGRIGIERLERNLTQLGGKPRLEEIGAAIDRVYRLPFKGIRRIVRLEIRIRIVQFAAIGIHFIMGQRELHILPP
jgi:hypothetical protein